MQHGGGPGSDSARDLGLAVLGAPVATVGRGLHLDRDRGSVLGIVDDGLEAPRVELAQGVVQLGRGVLRSRVHDVVVERDEVRATHGGDLRHRVPCGDPELHVHAGRRSAQGDDETNEAHRACGARVRTDGGRYRGGRAERGHLGGPVLVHPVALVARVLDLDRDRGRTAGERITDDLEGELVVGAEGLVEGLRCV